MLPAALALRSTTRPSSCSSWGGAAGPCAPAAAADFVAGYTCGNDVTARDLQKVDGQWTRAKSFDTFCPLGPGSWREAPPPRRRRDGGASTASRCSAAGSAT